MIEKIQPRLDHDYPTIRKINEIIDETNMNTEVITKHSQQLNRIEKDLKEIRRLLSQRVHLE